MTDLTLRTSEGKRSKETLEAHSRGTHQLIQADFCASEVEHATQKPHVKTHASATGGGEDLRLMSNTRGHTPPLILNDHDTSSKLKYVAINLCTLICVVP